MKFGREDVTRQIDTKGSTETVSTNYVSGTPTSPVRRSYAMRTRITDIDQMMKIANDFLMEVSNPNSKKLEPCLKIEHTSINRKTGTFDIIECYTVLEY